MQSKKYSPPKWCKDAVPSKQGWRHPKTGELLVRVLLPEEVFSPVPKEPTPEPPKVDSNKEVDDKETSDNQDSDNQETPNNTPNQKTESTESPTVPTEELSIVQRARKTRKHKTISV